MVKVVAGSRRDERPSRESDGSGEENACDCGDEVSSSMIERHRLHTRTTPCEPNRALEIMLEALNEFLSE